MKPIKQDIKDVFANIEKRYVAEIMSKRDFDDVKNFISNNIGRELKREIDVLLDTQLNYLMKYGTDYLKNADEDIQLAFYEFDFRKYIDEWVTSSKHSITMDTDIIEVVPDNRKKTSYIYGGTTLGIGTIITLFIPHTTLLKIISGLLTIGASIVAYKFGYEQGVSSSKEIYKDSFVKFLSSVKSETEDWLETVETEFMREFDIFCKTNNYTK